MSREYVTHIDKDEAEDFIALLQNSTNGANKRASTEIQDRFSFNFNAKNRANWEYGRNVELVCSAEELKKMGASFENKEFYLGPYTFVQVY